MHDITTIKEESEEDVEEEVGVVEDDEKALPFQLKGEINIQRQFLITIKNKATWGQETTFYLFIYSYSC